MLRIEPTIENGMPGATGHTDTGGFPLQSKHGWKLTLSAGRLSASGAHYLGVQMAVLLPFPHLAVLVSLGPYGDHPYIGRHLTLLQDHPTTTTTSRIRRRKSKPTLWYRLHVCHAFAVPATLGVGQPVIGHV